MGPPLALRGGGRGGKDQTVKIAELQGDLGGFSAAAPRGVMAGRASLGSHEEVCRLLVELPTAGRK